ncbi:MAG: MFS transporter [Bacillota bacterium]
MEAYSVSAIELNKEQKEKKEKSNIVLFLAGKLVSLLGTYIYNFALSYYILKVTGSGTSFALSLFMGVLPRVVMGPFAGSIADRFDRKKLVVGLDMLSGIVVLGMLGLSTIFGLSIVLIYAANLLLAIINTFFNTTIAAAVPNLVSDKSLMKIMSYSETMNSLSGIAGPILGGLIYATVSIELFLLVNGISFILSAISEMFIDFNFNKKDNSTQDKPKRITFKDFITDIKEVFVYIREKKALYTILKYAIALNFFIHVCLSVMLPYVVTNVLRMSSTQFGTIESAFPIGMLVMSLIFARLPEREKKHTMLTVGIGANGLLIILMGLPAFSFAGSWGINMIFGYYIVVCAVFAAFMIIVNVPLSTTSQRLIPDEIRGRAIGVLHSISGGVTPIGIILAGILVDIIPIWIAFFISGLMVMLMAVGMHRNKHIKEF